MASFRCPFFYWLRDDDHGALCGTSFFSALVLPIFAGVNNNYSLY